MSRSSSGMPASRAVHTNDMSKSAEVESLNELDGISLAEIVDHDSRPTFILDLDPDYLELVGKENEMHPIFCNTALRTHDRLLDNVTGAGAVEDSGQPGATTYQEFRSWATGATKFDDSRDVFPLTILYGGLLWTGSTIRKRWRIISGNKCYLGSHLPKESLPSELPVEMNTVQVGSSSPGIGFDSQNVTSLKTRHLPEDTGTVRSGDASHTTLVSSDRPLPSVEHSSKYSGGSSNETGDSGASIPLTTPENGFSDWTAAEPIGTLSSHAQFARSMDWASTPLGPMKAWSPELREVANLLMRNPHPAALLWGEELTMVYNDAYRIEVAGNKHPGLMGTGFSGPFSELWESVSPIFRECARTGNSIRRENDRLLIERYGYLEETFFSWSWTPLYGGTEKIRGFYNAPFETTYQTISSRRMQTLQYLGEKIAPTRTVKHFWKGVLEGLEDNPFDIPFAILYSISDSDEADTSSHSSESTISLKSCLLEGSIGVPRGHPAAPQKLDLKRSMEGFIPSFREAMRTREPTTLHTRDGTLPESLLEGIEWRGFGVPSKEAIIIPVRPTNGENVFAFLLMGVNPRRKYDEHYKAFASMLNRQLATSLASVLLFEDEVLRNRNAAELAALQREHLTQQLALQTSRLRRMTEFSPLGMFLFSPEGVLIEANDRYYEMTGHPRDSLNEMSFMDDLAEGSRKAAAEMWHNVTTDYKPRSEELQLKHYNVEKGDLTGEPIDYWVLASSVPEIGIDGKLRSIMGSITDISHIKWAQGLQDRRLREAEETKRQQNEFIDITSHEMRNPLSAILICADDIRDTLSEHNFCNKDALTIQNCIEAANTIALCVQHQKSIVDDILTISKLDSNLLHISPIPVQPVAVIERALSMFKNEIQAKEIKLNFKLHNSFQELEIGWVNLDPGRLLQITINLITNAIKFTQSLPNRVVSVSIGASTNPPEAQIQGFQYIPTRNSQANFTPAGDWGVGQVLYIHVEVQDTGCGLTAEEKQKLFERFAQASPRTHAHYGGSGLGLFISRQLAELHGGQIGVASEAGVGSTFGFYIQATRVAVSLGVEDLSQSSQEHGWSRQNKLHQAEPLGAQHPVTEAPAETVPKPEEPIRTMNPSMLHVLVVEDNIINQKVLKKQLQKVGCTVSTADNGISALDYLKTTEFQKDDGRPLSIILMDLEMPEMDGLTCVARIRGMEADRKIKRHVPVIAVTANIRDEQIATARNSGMDDVVLKPFRISELLAKMELLLGRLANG